MRCPWNDWKDCFKNECPFYEYAFDNARDIQGRITPVVTEEVCQRAEAEKPIVINVDFDKISKIARLRER